MIEIIIITHGKLSEEILRTAELIVGPADNVSTLTLERNDSIEDLSIRLSNKLDIITDKNKVLILTDLLGGSPFNISNIYIKKYGYKLIAGLNLPMLIEAIIGSNGDDIEELTRRCIHAGKEGIRNVEELIN